MRVGEDRGAGRPRAADEPGPTFGVLGMDSGTFAPCRCRTGGMMEMRCACPMHIREVNSPVVFRSVQDEGEGVGGLSAAVHRLGGQPTAMAAMARQSWSERDSVAPDKQPIGLALVSAEAGSCECLRPGVP